MAITDVLNLTPQLVAEQNPELHQMRKIAFGENYLSDIAQTEAGEPIGTSRYYTGWGNVPNWAQQADAAAQGTQIVDTPGGEITGVTFWTLPSKFMKVPSEPAKVAAGKTTSAFQALSLMKLP